MLAIFSRMRVRYVFGRLVTLMYIRLLFRLTCKRVFSFRGVVFGTMFGGRMNRRICGMQYHDSRVFQNCLNPLDIEQWLADECLFGLFEDGYEPKTTLYSTRVQQFL